MTSRIALDTVRLELAKVSAEVRELSERVQGVSHLLDQWAEQEGLIEDHWSVIEEETQPFGMAPTEVLELRKAPLRSVNEGAQWPGRPGAD